MGEAFILSAGADVPNATNLTTLLGHCYSFSKGVTPLHGGPPPIVIYPSAYG